jgi:hypothetical protein
MATEFDKINDLPGWRAKLDELIAAAREAMQDDDLDKRMAIANRLTDFIVYNPPALPEDLSTAEYEEMDRVAKGIHDALLLATIRERVAAIMSTTAELAAYRKKIEGRPTAAATASAKVRRVVNASTAAIAAMADLKKEIERAASGRAPDPKMTALGTQLAALIDAVQTFRNEVETSW